MARVASNIYSAFFKGFFAVIMFVILITILLIPLIKIESSLSSIINSASPNSRSIVSRVKYFKLIYSNILVNIISRIIFNNNGRGLFFIINRIFDGDLLKIFLISFFKILFYTVCAIFLLLLSPDTLKLSKFEFEKKYNMLFMLTVVNSVSSAIIIFKKS